MCCDNKGVLFVQVDLCPEEMGNNVRPAVALLGDINAIVTQVTTTQRAHILFLINPSPLCAYVCCPLNISLQLICVFVEMSLILCLCACFSASGRRT